jgi:hypothetical protein
LLLSAIHAISNCRLGLRNGVASILVPSDRSDEMLLQTSQLTDYFVEPTLGSVGSATFEDPAIEDLPTLVLQAFK